MSENKGHAVGADMSNGSALILRRPEVLLEARGYDRFGAILEAIRCNALL